MTGLPERVYLHSPLWAKKMLLNAHALRLHRRRYGKGFEETLQEAINRDSWTADAMSKYRHGRLEALMSAARRTAYWTKMFSEYGIDADPSRDPFESLHRLPLLDKAAVKQHRQDIRNPAVPVERVIPRQTSGTTGSGLKLLETLECERETWAVWWRYRLRHGIGLHQKCGYFGGRTIISPERTRPPYWLYNRVWNQLLFSAYHLSRNTARHYTEAIRTSSLEWLHGYPSTLSLLAGFMKDLGLTPVESVRNVTFGAESLSARQRDIVQEMFPNARLSEQYGLAEGVANVSECERGMLHVDEDFALVEFVEVPGDPGVREIVGTNWTNPAFPLLRYCTGDFVKLHDDDCPCGRPSRVVAEIHGRREDVVVLPDGRAIGRLDHMFKDMVNITEAQIHQYNPQQLEVRIVKSRNYSSDDEAALTRNIRERVGTAVGLELRYVPALERGPSGKLKFVVSHLQEQNVASV